MYKNELKIDNLLLLWEMDIINGSNMRHLECYIVVKLTNKPYKGLPVAL